MKIHEVCADKLKMRWYLEKMILSSKAQAFEFPKPTWKQATTDPVELTDRLQVEQELLLVSKRDLEGVRTCRIWHGTPDFETAKSISKNGFAGNVQKVEGWFGEGV